MRLNGSGSQRSGNGFANGKASRLGFAPAALESVLSTKSVNELLELFEATGDQAPFEEIVRRYAGMVFNVCYQVSRDSHEAEDATQAVFLTLAVRSKTAQKIQYLGPWLQRVAQRLSLDMKRSKKRRAAREVKHHDLNVSRWEANNGPRDLGMDELRGILRDEIDRLPAKYRMPLILHYFGGLKPEEMSKELGIKANTLGVRLHRARKMLGDNLQKKGVVVGGTMLTAALGALVPMYIQHTLAGKATSAAAAYSFGHALVAADVATNVIGAMNAAHRASILAKIKAVTAAVAIGAAAVAGAGQLVRTISHGGFEFRNFLDAKRWLSPFIERLRSPIRVGDSSVNKLDQILRAKPPAQSLASVRAADRLGIDAAHANLPEGPEQIFASAGELGGRSTRLLQQAAPVFALYPSTDFAPAVARPLSVSFAAPVAWSTHAVANNVGKPAHAALPPQSFATAGPALSSTQALDARFNAARGSFTLDGGRLDRSAILLDSQNQAIRTFRVSSGELRTRHLAIADAGDAEFVQTGGRVEAQRLTLAAAEGSRGSYDLAGGELFAQKQLVGVSGTATFTQEGGLNTADTVSLALDQPSQGLYRLQSGRLTARELNIGVSGIGEYAQSGGEARIIGSGDTGGVRVAVNPGSRGTVRHTGGRLEADKVFVGLGGDGHYTLAGGETVTNKIVIGTSDNSNSRLLAIEGKVIFDRVVDAGLDAFASNDAPATNASGALTGARSGQLQYNNSTAGAFTVAAADVTKSAIVVGLNGDGVFQLGNARESANFSEGSPQSRTPLVIRAVPSAQGEVIGWGDIDLRGPLINNGRLIADGYGRSRVLDLSSVASVTNTIENEADGAHGLYARRNGQLRLPAIHVPSDGDFNWGESANDRVPDLVNSVRLGFSGVKAAGTASLTLLSPDDPSATTALGAPADAVFVGLWKFDRTGLESDSTRLLVRYDEQMVEHLGLPEAALSLWAYDGSWQQMSLADTILDIDQNLIGGELSSQFEYFGVSLSALGAAGMAVDGQSFSASGTANSMASARSAAFIESVNLLGASPTVDLLAGDGQTIGGIVGGVTTRATGVPEPSAGALVIAATGLLAHRRRRIV